MIRKALAKCTFSSNLQVVRNGEDAVAHIRRLAGDPSEPCPALLLLDLNIPRIPGVEVLRELRSATRCSRTSVIVVSSSDSKSDREAVHRLGANAYFRKPSDLGAYLDLSRVVQNVLDYAASNSELQ